jgi:hypothetical protein
VVKQAIASGCHCSGGVLALPIYIYIYIYYIFVVFSQSYSNDGVQQLNETDKCNQISDSLKNKTLGSS